MYMFLNYKFIVICSHLCHNDTRVNWTLQFSKPPNYGRRANGPLTSLPKLSGQRSGRKGLQRFRKGVMHLLFQRFFFHPLSLSWYLLLNMATLAALPWLCPSFLRSKLKKPWKTVQGFGKGKGKGQADIVPWMPFWGFSISHLAGLCL